MIERIFILHHTHVDLGFTDQRDKIYKDLADMVETALDLVKRSKDRPEPERFRWIHEVSWPIIEYIRRGGKRQSELFEQIRQGNHELNAFYVNPTDLFDLDSFRYCLDYADRLAKDHQLPLTTAMFSDCPGIAWSIPDLLAERGIRFLSAAPDPIMSMPLTVERPFYWEGPGGGRVLTWFTEWRKYWYAEGYLGFGLCGDVKEAAGKVMEYVDQLEGEGYRWKGLAIHYANDNMPPAPRLMDFVAHFNTSQTRVRAGLATNRDFFEFMEKTHGGQFAVYRGAWPDWWANGNASAAYEVACSRHAKDAVRRSLALGKMLGREISPDKLQEIREEILLFDEHTWGVENCIREPWSPTARLQWTQKRVFAFNGYVKAKLLEKEIAGQISEKETQVVCNSFTSDWAGVLGLKVNDKTNQVPALVDLESQETIHGQRHRDTDYYFLSVSTGQKRRFKRTPCESSPVRTGECLDNDQFQIQYDSNTGAIQSILDKSCRRELVDTRAPWSLGELIHEVLVSGKRESIYDISFKSNNAAARQPRPEFIRRGGHTAKREVTRVMGPVFDALVTSGDLPGVKFIREIRLYHNLRRIDIVLRLDKEAEVNYEGLYLAFPFAADPPEVWLENAGTVYRAGVDQLPGSATDWHSLGDYAAVSDPSKTIILVPHEVPLVQVSDINTGKWADRLDVSNGHLYSWIMTNMWITNFPACQEGVTDLTWSLTTHSGPFNRAMSEQFAQATRVGIANADGDFIDQSLAW